MSHLSTSIWGVRTLFRLASHLINARRTLSCALLWLCLCSTGSAQTFFPLKDVRPGLRGVGRTVFSGDRIDNFEVEILGVLQNVTPGQPIVLARLSGGPLAQTGILQGMSGSPVYIDGKLLGAVALGFPFSKEPIAGIQPIEQMIADSSLSAAPGQPAAFHPLQAELPPSPSWAFFRPRVDVGTQSAIAAPISTPFGALNQLPTPLSLSGFTTASIQTLSPQFRALGFETVSALAASGSPGMQTRPPVASTQPPASTPAPDASRSVVPGSMISVGLLTGDMNITADGTVTYVDGRRVYAFGHRFLDTGSTELPFAHSSVVALIPNLNSSFKLSVPRAWAGTILSDRASAISGEIGRPSHTLPMTVTVHSRATGDHRYSFQVVNDRFLTPFVVQTALFSVIDATERTLGRGTLQLTGEVEWDAHLPPLHIRDTFVSDSGLAQQVSTDAAVPLGFVLGAGFQNLHPQKISFQLDASESKRQLHVAQAWMSSHEVRPGDLLQINILLEGENGVQFARSADYPLPTGAPAGSLNFTISDGNTLNFPEFAGLSQSALRSPEDLIRTVNSFRDSDAVYIRVWRPQPSFIVAGSSASGDLSDPPPSVALVLSDPSNSATANPALTQTRGSQVAELTIPTGGYVVTGSKTLQVEVKP